MQTLSLLWLTARSVYRRSPGRRYQSAQRRFERWSLATLFVALSINSASLAAQDQSLADQDPSLSAQDPLWDQVAPLLERKCVTCHNDQQREGNFSLQSAPSAFADGYIRAGDPAASHLLDLITAADGVAAMPQDGAPLLPSEVQLVRDWIQGGAKWPADVRLAEPQVNDFAWWSYQPLNRPAVPQIEGANDATEIDRFVLAKLAEQGLTPSPPADRRTLIRRLTYDLIGLPPSPTEVAAFESDTDPNAYEKVVDRLLDSPRYGEHWARHWLDVAKYADSCGYDKDKLRPNAWPYRDYVIRSLNQDKPYSRFVQEQIAGDVLFPDDPDGIIGLGFIAAGPWDFIGHVEVSQEKTDGKVARNLDRDDMVAGALNTFCSLTVQCARCHHHKFDPITQDHYYGLQSIFAAVDRADRSFDPDPVVARERRQLTARRDELQAARTAIEDEIAVAGGSALADASAAVTHLETRLTPHVPPEHGYHSEVATTQDQEKWIEVQLPSETAIDRIVLHPCHDNFNGIGAGFGFPLRFRIDTFDQAGNRTTVFDGTAEDVTNPGISEVAYHLPNPGVQRVRITATRLAVRANDYIFALAELRILAGEKNVATNGVVDSADSIEAPQRWSRQNLVDGIWPHLGEARDAENLAAAKARYNTLYQTLLDQPSADAELTRHEALRANAEQIANVESRLQTLPPPQMVYAATTHFSPEGNFQPTAGKAREVFVLARGEVSQPAAKAIPGVVPLSAQSQWQFSDDLNEGQRRAHLAGWLVDHDHPLVWRSIVNRVWQYHFGEGIVATPNDFGRMGALPTHPELLDWLAVEFRDGGQSLKALHRMIVTSDTYRQSSADIPANSLSDGGNQFLWRANRKRLSAEELRDSLLVISGAMNFEIGGPGYYLFVLEKTEHSPHFEYHKFDPADPTSHRRSIYRFIARSQPNPYMTTLDCADSSQSTPRRNETLTSLQALALLNNRFHLVMAERFAARMEAEAGDAEAQVRLAMSLIAQRSLTDQEVSELVDYRQAHGMANLCRLLFNLSEFVFVD